MIADVATFWTIIDWQLNRKSEDSIHETLYWIGSCARASTPMAPKNVTMYQQHLIDGNFHASGTPDSAIMKSLILSGSCILSFFNFARPASFKHATNCENRDWTDCYGLRNKICCFNCPFNCNNSNLKCDCQIKFITFIVSFISDLYRNLPVHGLWRPVCELQNKCQHTIWDWRLFATCALAHLWLRTLFLLLQTQLAAPQNDQLQKKCSISLSYTLSSNDAFESSM